MEVSISQEDLDNSLVVLPPPPQELEAKNSYVKCSLSHHRTILTLLHLKLSGLVIRKQPQLLGCLDELDEARQSCMFIPAPSFNKILLFMNLEKVFDENAIDQIVKSIERQLELVNQNVMEVDVEQKSLSEKLEVQLLVCASNRLLNSELFKQFEKILLFLTAVSGRFSNIKVGVMYSDKKSLERKIRFIVNIPAPESSVIRNLQKYYIVKLQPIEDIYRLSLPTELETFVEESIHMFKSNFPDRREKLIIIPCLDKLKADELSVHYVDTKSDDSLSVSKKLFSPTLRGVCGILVQGFSSDHLRTIVDQDFLQPQKFEFDWVYLGNMHIVVLEVGIQRSHEHLLQTVKENIIKSLTRTIPNFNLVLYSLWKSFEQKSLLKVSKCSFRDVYEEIFHHIIYLPKVGHDTFIKTIQTIRESLSESGEARQNNATKDALFQHKFLKVVKMMKPASRIAFMLHSNWNSEPIIVQVDSGFNLVENCEKLEEELFDIVAAGSKKSRPTEMKQQFLAFASSLISTASLKFGDFDAQERTAVSIREWKKLQKEQLLDFNLSQHQRRILSDTSNTHLLITGDAGSEKSALLLSKCEQMAKRGDVDKILLFYDHQGKFLRKYLEGLHEIKMLLRLKTNTLFEVRPIAEFDAAVANERNFNRTVLLIHELRSRTNIINWNIISYFKCSWITSFGIDGPSKSVISKFSRNFKRKHLKTSQETEGHLPSGKRHERVGDILHNESLSTEKTKEVSPHNSFKNAELRKDRTEAKSARKVLSTSEQNEQLTPEMDSMMVNFSNDFDKYNLGGPIGPITLQLIEESGSYCEQNLCKDHNFEPNSTYESTQFTQTQSVDSSDDNPNNDQEEESFYGSSVTCENRQHGDLDVLEEVTVWDGSERTTEIIVSRFSVGRYKSSIVLHESETKNLTFEFSQPDGSVQKIGINFPCYCILGTKKLFLEFYFPDCMKKKLYGKEILLTPVLFIYQAMHVPFLRKVIVKLPFDQRVLTPGDDFEITNDNAKKIIVVKENHFEIHSFSFSPAGVTGQEVHNQLPQDIDDRNIQLSDNQNQQELDNQTRHQPDNQTRNELDNQAIHGEHDQTREGPNSQTRRQPDNQTMQEREKQKKKWRALRALNIGDQKLLYDSSAVYFTMDQVQEPLSDNQYILSFNCRSFSSWPEFDPYCWKENLSMHSLSQYNVFKGMIQRQQIVVHIKEVNAPVSIYSLNIDDSTLSDSPNIGHPAENGSHSTAVAVSFENLGGFSAEYLDENNRSQLYYSFNDNNELCHKPSAIIFSFGQQLFKFPMLNRDELNHLQTEPPISTDLIRNFLKLLNCNWTMFLTSELSVPKPYLFDFALMDLLDSVEERLPKQPSSFIAQQKLPYQLVSIEENLVEKWNDLEAFRLPDQQNRDTKLSILTLCERKFSDLYSDNLKTAKLEIISRVVGEDLDDCGLSDENELILAQHLLTIKSHRLITKMKNAIDRYEIRGELTPDLERLLDEQIGGGDDL